MSLEQTITDAVRQAAKEEFRTLIAELRKATDDRVIAPREAAKMLGVGTATIARMIRDGRIPSFSIGRHRRIRVADLPHRRA